MDILAGHALWACRGNLAPSAGWLLLGTVKGLDPIVLSGDIMLPELHDNTLKSHSTSS